jgi:hypothetical protein
MILDLILYGIGVWLMIGLLPAIFMMFARGRQGYYVDPFSPLRGALQGPFALWTAIMTIRRGQR